MSELWPALGLAVLACCVAALIGRFLIWKGPRDHPDGGRKSQAQAMPTSGGLAVFFAVLPLSLVMLLISDDWFSFTYIALFASCIYMLNVVCLT